MVKLKVGAKHQVLLQKEGVGGYTWQLKKVVPETGLRIEKCAEQQPSPNVPGASAAVCYAIVAFTPGNFEVVFEYRRLWENKKKAEDIVTLIVDVV